MAKKRKRFYVVVFQSGLRRVISCKYKPCLAVGAFLGLTRAVGPFRTFDQASEAIGRV